MKILFFISFLLYSALVFSQGFPNNQSVSNASTLYHAKGGITGDVGFVNTRYTDTSAANLTYIAGEAGSQIAVGNTIYVRDSTATRWLVSSASGNDTAFVSYTMAVDSSYLLSNHSNRTISSDTLIVVADGLTGGNNGSSYQLPYNGNSTDYLGGDTAYHSLITPPSMINWSVIDSVNSVVTSMHGDIYLVGTSPTGAFAGQANKIATYDSTSGGSWSFQSAIVGDLLFNSTKQVTDKWDGTNWLRVQIDNYVHIDYPEKVIGKKTFTDTIKANKGVMIDWDGVGVRKFLSVGKGNISPQTSIEGDAYGSSLNLGGWAAGPNLIRIVGNYVDSIITGTYRPLHIDVHDYLDIRANRGANRDSAIRFRVGNNYAGIFHNNRQLSLNGYSSRNFYHNDTSNWKPVLIDNSGNIGQGSWVGGGTPSLQEVTDVGSVTTNGILSTGSFMQVWGNNTDIQVGLDNTSTGNFMYLKNDGSTDDDVYLSVGNPMWESKLKFNSVTSNRIWQMPDKSGIIALEIDSTVTLSAGTITVSDTRIKTGAKIFVSCNTPSGTQGFLSAKTSDIVDGTSFIINSSSSADNSTVNYTIVNP